MRPGTWLADLHAQLRCPLVVVGDHADEVDEIVALELGADAYLTHPLAPRRLRAHLAALMRLRGLDPSPEREPAAPSATLAHPDWQLDRIANRLLVDGRHIALTDVQSALLQCLVEARGRIVPRSRLCAALANGKALGARSVDVYIHRLRGRLSDEGLATRVAIEAVRGRGYLLKTTRGH